MTDSDKKTLAGCLTLGLIPALPLKFIYFGWALAKTWNWFLPQYFGLRDITICEAIGLDLVLTFIVTTNLPVDPKSPDKKLEKAITTWFYAIFAPLLMLLVGYIVKSFM